MVQQLDLLGNELPLVAPKPSEDKKIKPQLEAQMIGEPTVVESESDMPEDHEDKAPSAFRTISEVASFLGVPQHVLRFWESRFSQIKPLKMRGGRRYYRPEDVDALTKVHSLLYKEGYTIKGAKKALTQPARPVVVAAPEKKAAPVLAKSDAQAKGLTDKQRNQLMVIRQELIAMRDILEPHVPS